MNVLNMSVKIGQICVLLACVNKWVSVLESKKELGRMKHMEKLVKKLSILAFIPSSLINLSSIEAILFIVILVFFNPSKV